MSFSLGGLPVRLRTDDARIRAAAAAGLARRSPSAAEAGAGPPLELCVRRGALPPPPARARRWARWTPPGADRSGARAEIAAPWFRLRTDDAGRHMDAEIDAAYGMGDFYRQALGTALLLRDGFLLHAAALEMPDGGAWLFCGPSGFGKTTLARLAPRRAVLADDTVAIRVAPGQARTETRRGASLRGRSCEIRGAAVLVHPTPFFGDFGAPPRGLRPDARRVDRIFFLAPHGRAWRLGAPKRRTLVDLYRMGAGNGTEAAAAGPHRIEPVGPAEAAALLLAQVIAPDASPADVQRRLLERVARVAERVPVFRLAFRPDASLWPFLMQGRRITTAKRKNQPPKPLNPPKFRSVVSVSSAVNSLRRSEVP